MASYRIPYGKTALSIDLPDRFPIDLLSPKQIDGHPDPALAVAQALSQALGTKRLPDFQGARTVSISINDKTRPVPHQHLLPPLLRNLEHLGIRPEGIQLIIASGAHPPMKEGEFALVLPENIRERYPVYAHDCDDHENLVFLGQTRRQTPVWINRKFLEADLRIVVGNIAPHQFQGFSGGVKSAAIGLAGRETIDRNHAMMMDELARLGQFKPNPARQDVEEIGEKIGIHYALNAILNDKKQIVEALFGSPTAVMQAGLPLARRICQIQVDRVYDLMIVSPGGYPKDINLYQAQKGLAHASLVTKKGGTILLAAACSEGTGSPSYERWVQQIKSVEELFDRFQREDFRVGPHKAFQIARDTARVNFFLISEMPAAFVRSLLINPAESLQIAVNSAVSTLPSSAHIGIMPHANGTIPFSLNRPSW